MRAGVSRFVGESEAPTCEVSKAVRDGQMRYSRTNTCPPFRMARRHLHPKYRPDTVSCQGASNIGSLTAAGRADACWLPVASGLTPHGLRHTHKTLMEELGTAGQADG